MTNATSLVEKRTDLLASLYLTRDPAVVTRVEDIDLDFIVHLFPDGTNQGSVPAFGVIVRGTAIPLESAEAAERHLNHQWAKLKAHRYFMPVIALLFSMNQDQGYYTWVSEPRVDPVSKLPVLVKLARPEFEKVSGKTYDRTMSVIREWYGRLAEIVFERN
jgi:hypothetical protein